MIDWLLGYLFHTKEDFKELQELYGSSKEYTYLEALAYSL